MENKYFRQAIEEAQEGMEKGHGGPFGAVIVYRGEVIAAAHNEVLSTNDPTAHAEILAIRAASRKLGRFHLEGCTLYCTGEPCPMCFGAIHWARLDRVLYCTGRSDAAAIGFDDAFITEILRGERPDPIPFLRRDRPECRTLLRLWDEKEDKIPY